MEFKCKCKGKDRQRIKKIQQRVDNLKTFIKKRKHRSSDRILIKHAKRERRAKATKERKKYRKAKKLIANIVTLVDVVGDFVSSEYVLKYAADSTKEGDKVFIFSTIENVGMWSRLFAVYGAILLAWKYLLLDAGKCYFFNYLLFDAEEWGYWLRLDNCWSIKWEIGYYRRELAKLGHGDNDENAIKVREVEAEAQAFFSWMMLIFEDLPEFTCSVIFLEHTGTKFSLLSTPWINTFISVLAALYKLFYSYKLWKSAWIDERDNEITKSGSRRLCPRCKGTGRDPSWCNGGCLRCSHGYVDIQWWEDIDNEQKRKKMKGETVINMVTCVPGEMGSFKNAIQDIDGLVDAYERESRVTFQGYERGLIVRGTRSGTKFDFKVTQTPGDRRLDNTAKNTIPITFDDLKEIPIKFSRNVELDKLDFFNRSWSPAYCEERLRVHLKYLNCDVRRTWMLKSWYKLPDNMRERTMVEVSVDDFIFRGDHYWLNRVLHRGDRGVITEIRDDNFVYIDFWNSKWEINETLPIWKTKVDRYFKFFAQARYTKLRKSDALYNFDDSSGEWFCNNESCSSTKTGIQHFDTQYRTFSLCRDCLEETEAMDPHFDPQDVLNDPIAYEIFVTGAGTADCNGSYINFDGEKHCEKLQWRVKKDKPPRIFWNTNGTWNMTSEDNERTYETIAEPQAPTVWCCSTTNPTHENPIPPTDGWKTTREGRGNPSPTLVIRKKLALDTHGEDIKVVV